MNTQLRASTLWIILKLSLLEGTVHDDSCNFTGEMCGMEKCIAKMEELNNTKRCIGIVFGPGTLYNNRDDAPFWITIKAQERYRYPDDLVYTILNLQDGLSFNALTQVPGCCSLKLGEKCILPKRQTEFEFNTIYIPLKQNPDNKSYCYFDIQEAQGIIEYCKDEDDIVCYEITENGVLYKRDAFFPVSTALYYPSLTEFCLFPTPSSFITKHGSESSRNFFPLQTNITHSGSGRNINAILGDKEIKCDIVETTNSQSQNPGKLADEYYDGVHDFVCFFFRAPTENINWATHPLCVRIKLKDNAAIIVFASVFVSMVVTFFIIMIMIWIYRKHVLQCTYKRSICQLPESLKLSRDEGCVVIDTANQKRLSGEQQLKEIPELIKWAREASDKDSAKTKDTEILSSIDQICSGRMALSHANNSDVSKKVYNSSTIPLYVRTDQNQWTGRAPSTPSGYVSK